MVYTMSFVMCEVLFLLGFAINVFIVELGISYLLAAVQAVVSRERVAERNRNKVVRHSFKSKQLEANEER